MNLKMKRDSPNAAYGTPRKRRNAPYTAARDLSRGPKAAVMTRLKVSNDSRRLGEHLALSKVYLLCVHT